MYPSQAADVSPLEEHEDFILGLIKEQPDMTLDEIVAAMKKAKIAASRTAVWRFFDRRDITFKKKLCMRKSKGGPSAPARADVGSESRACLTPQNWCLSTVCYRDEPKGKKMTWR